MVKRNIQIKKRVSGTEWDNLYPITTADNVLAANGENLTTQINGIQNKIEGTRFSDLAYPLFIAHRGSAHIYPENTLEGMIGTIELGHKFIEFDCRQLIDGTLAVHHDETVGRMTDGVGDVADYSAMGFKNLKTISPFYKNVSCVTLDEILVALGNRAFYLVESKDMKSAGAIARKFKEYQLEENVIVQSFDYNDLVDAVTEGVATMELGGSPVPDPVNSKNLGFDFVGTHETNITQQFVDDVHAQGLKVVTFTVNHRYRCEELLNMGVDAFFTDDPFYLTKKMPVLTKDPFKNQQFYHGMVAAPSQFDYRGGFLEGNKWGFTATGGDRNFMLQGWAGELPDTFTVTFDMTIEEVGLLGWGSIAICSPIDYFDDNYNNISSGYHLLWNESNDMSLYRAANGVATKLGDNAGPSITSPTTKRFSVQVTSSQIIFSNETDDRTVVVNDTTYRNGYLHFGRKWNKVSFANVSISS
jgi:glycerophosphoryl diester phosphodiesterase